MVKREKFDRQLRDVNRQIGDKHTTLAKLAREETRLAETITNMQAKIDRLVKEERELVARNTTLGKELRDPNNNITPLIATPEKVVIEEPSNKEKFKRKHADISGNNFYQPNGTGFFCSGV